MGLIFGGNIVEGGFDAWVNFRVVEEGVGYYLDAAFSVFFEGRGGLCSGWLLIWRAAIDWCIILVRLMMGLGGRYMITFIEGAVDVVL